MARVCSLRVRFSLGVSLWVELLGFWAAWVDMMMWRYQYQPVFMHLQALDSRDGFIGIVARVTELD